MTLIGALPGMSALATRMMARQTDLDSFIPQVSAVLTVGEFYELAAGGQIIFT